MTESNDVADLVTGAMGDSVTPTQLLNANTGGFLGQFLDTGTIEGPFTEYLEAGEQPHYIFHSTPGIRTPEDSENDGDGSTLPLLGRITANPAVALITDKRSTFIQKHDGAKQVLSIDHSNLIDIELRDLKATSYLSIISPQQEVTLELWTTDAYSGEISDAAAYIMQQSTVTGDYQKYSFDAENIASAGDALRDQLRDLDNVHSHIDTENVVKSGLTGAKIGWRTKNNYGAAAGFILGAGYSLWSDLAEAPSNINTEDIDPNETAETITTWQDAGKATDQRGTELAASVIGAAIAIDQQTHGHQATSILAEADIADAARQLTEGNKTEAGVTLASDVAHSYSEELSDLLEDDFFTKLNSST